MVVGRVAGVGFWVLFAIGTGCGNSARAVGTIMDASPDEPRADAPLDASPGETEADAPIMDVHFLEGARFENGPVVGSCGNGQIGPGEECDDGNTLSGDGCTSLCQVECPAASIYCQPLGAPGVVCGDAVPAVGEGCDDGNVTPGDGCSSGCAVEPGWTCPVPGHRCSPVCGDGIVTAPETCDDGNQQSGDGCSSTCIRESPCFASDGSPVPCPSTCGDGHIDGSEECDDGSSNADVPGACSSTCHLLSTCGDGVITPPETCDLGPNNAPVPYLYNPPAGGCSSVCTPARYCGDGHTDLSFGEQCDLGSSNGQPVSVGGTVCVICDAHCQFGINC